MPNPAMALEAAEPSRSPDAALAGKYLVFRLGDESYGIAVLRVREIMRMTSVTAIPQMPPHVRGVINLRGRVVPVLDLRARFGMPPIETDGRTCILVVQVALPGGATPLMGAVVDWVEEVLPIRAEEIEQAPSFGSAARSEYVLGIAKTKGGVRILLDIDRAVGVDLPAGLEV